jgi:hypothetical protein
MSIRTIALLVLALTLQACGTVPFTPTEYPLRDGLISSINANGPVSITNAQDSTAPAILHSYGGTRFQSDYHAVTNLMVQQAQKELLKAAQSRPGKAKSIALKVTFLESNYSFFYYKSSINFDVKLGGDAAFTLTVPHSSGNPVQDLNGCIAEGVMTLLNDSRVRSYLAS